MTAAAEELEAVAAVTDGETAVIDEVVADKGYHSNQVLVDLAALDLRTYIAEPDRGRRKWKRQPAARTPCTPTAGASAARAGGRCSGAAASDWNARMRISTKPVGCGARICAGTRTS